MLLFNNESYFMVNWAEAYGGAVLLKASHGILINNTFFNNKAFDGGAVYALSLGQLKLTNGSKMAFKNNTGK